MSKGLSRSTNWVIERVECPMVKNVVAMLLYLFAWSEFTLITATSANLSGKAKISLASSPMWLAKLMHVRWTRHAVELGQGIKQGAHR
jgi:hypothetical protein